VQIFKPDVDSFVREVLQNCRDQRVADDRVDVRFTLTELSEADQAILLEAIDWPVLMEHLDATARPELVTIGPRLREGLELTGEGKLRILRIQDTGTRGLTGGEDDDENFAALVRHDLITAGHRRESGGSFGVGKGVLWRFSNLSTVLFHSLLWGTHENRFIGRTALAAHEAEDEKWEGPGWFGARDPDEPKRAISIWGDEARQVAALTKLARPEGMTGVSILVLGFDDPSRVEEPSVAEMCEEMVASATRWFWPALRNDDISVLVEGFKGDERVFTAHAHAITPEVAPFVHAQQDTATPDDALDEPGDVAEKTVTITLPAQRPALFEHSHGQMQASATLRVRLAESGETERRNTVALQRGTGMVVQYRDLRVRAAADQAFHAVLLAGRAHGDAESDRALEAFLRAAEPPTHQEWTHTTERIKAEYGPGYKRALDDLYAAIETAVRDLSQEEVIESGEGPDTLKKLFPLPGIGEPVREETYRLTEANAKLVDDHWRFDGRFRRRPVDEQDRERDWEARVALAVDQEGTGTPTRIHVSELWAAAPAIAEDVAKDGTVTIQMPANLEELSFSGTSVPILDLPAGGLRRVRLRMDLRGASRRDGQA
jgi:hypothetical protein